MPISVKQSLGLVVLSSVLVVACNSTTTRPTSGANLPVLQPDGGAPADVSELYRSIGLLAAPSPLAFVGKISSFASARPDTTLVLASISVPNRALTFTREGDRYRAPYEVKISMSRGDVEVANVNAMEIVRVGSFREINRTDESAIFQHYFHVSPGVYSLSAMVRDVGGSRNATQQAMVSVPSLSSGRFSTPLLVYEAAGRTRLSPAPQVLASPRSGAVFGRGCTVGI